MRVSEIPEFANYKNIYGFVHDHLDMQFRDIRGMMRLPLKDLGIDGGCNFAAALAMCNMINGISRVLYQPSKKIPKSSEGSEIRFKQYLRDYFPWGSGDKREGVVNIIYDVFRNPLTHSLGVQSKQRTRKVWINKSPLSEEQITQLETNEKRPAWADTAVLIEPDRLVLNDIGLYWALFEISPAARKRHQSYASC